MDPTIVAAIIGALALILVTLIPYIMKKSKDEVDPPGYRSLRVGIICGNAATPEAIALTPVKLPIGNAMEVAIRAINAITKTPSDVEYLIYDLSKKTWIHPSRVMDLPKNTKIVLVQRDIANSWGKNTKSAHKIIANTLSL